MALLVAKVPFGFSLEKGFYYLWFLKAVFSWKHYFYSVFSKTQLCRHERMQLEQKQKFTKNRGCLPKCKKVFFWYVFFCFLVVLFFVACVLVLVFCKKKAQKGCFPAILEVFCLFCSHKRPVLRCLFSFFFCFFCFCLLFQNSILSLCVLAISPCLENINIFWFLSFSFCCLFLS